MRRDFAQLLFDEMATNKDIYLITGDLGYGLWDKVRDTYPARMVLSDKDRSRFKYEVNASIAFCMKQVY